MVISFRVVSESVSPCNVLKEAGALKARMKKRFVQRFLHKHLDSAGTEKGRHHRIDMALSDSMGFSFSPSSQCLGGQIL